MKQYHHIEYFGKNLDLPIIAFDKLDGSNLRFEWSHKRGFYKAGTRGTMIDKNSEPFGKGVEIFLNKYSDDLTKIFSSKEYRNIQSFVCFAEFVGRKSEFGQHDFENDEFDVVLFDVDRYKKGFVPPKQFVKDFGHLDIAKVVYEGNLSKEFIQRVKDNEFNLKEGVICKGLVKTKKGAEQIYYCKIKTKDWLDKLKERYLNLYNEEMKDYKDETLDWEDPIYDV